MRLQAIWRQRFQYCYFLFSQSKITSLLKLRFSREVFNFKPVASFIAPGSENSLYSYCFELKEIPRLNSFRVLFFFRISPKDAAPASPIKLYSFVNKLKNTKI